VNFYTVVEAARARNETPLGYVAREAGESTGVLTLNPLKSATRVYRPGDRIVVLAEK
jgi:hypothetical protein